MERLAEAADRVGDRWSLLLIAALLEEPATFQQLKESLGISPAVLSSRLKDLEGDQLVVGRPYQQRPVRLAYELTAQGESLRDALVALAGWAGDKPVHETCGTQAELTWWCPMCDARVDAEHAALHRL